MNPLQLLAHFDRISETPDAVPRFRQLILALAVRGNLTRPESGSGTSDWKAQKLKDCAQIINGRAYKQHELLSSGIPVIRIQNLNGGSAWYYSDLQLEPEKYCDPGDLLYAWSGTFGPYLWKGPRGIFHYHIWKLNLGGHVEKQFMFYLLEHLTAAIKEEAHGLMLPHMTKEGMESWPVSLPPLAEQRRIIARVAELMALCDELETAQRERESRRDRIVAASLQRLNEPTDDRDAFREHARFYLHHLPRLTTRPEHIQQLRQTLVRLAAMGKLLPQDKNEERADRLLDRLQEERRRVLGSRDTRNAPSVDESDRQYPIPDSWRWTTLGELGFGLRYGTSAKCSYDRVGVPVLRIPNVIAGRISIKDLKFGLLSQREVAGLALQAGDILLVRSNGSLKLVGRAALVDDAVAGYCYAGYLVRFRPALKCVDSRYLLLVLNGDDVREQIELPIRTTVGLKNVNSAEFNRLRIPLPPLAEQRRIVGRIEQLTTLCDELEAQLTVSEAQSRHLLEATVHQALHGTPRAAIGDLACLFG